MTGLTPETIVDARMPSDPRVSPDGSLVAFVVAPMGQRGEHRESAIRLAGTDGSPAPRKLTAGHAEDASPRWSPDGEWLYFSSDRVERGKAQIYRLPARTAGEAEVLTSWKAGVEGFVPLPDGRTVAFWAKDEPTEEDERRERERDDAEVFGERWPYARLRLLERATDSHERARRCSSAMTEAGSRDRRDSSCWRTPRVSKASGEDSPARARAGSQRVVQSSTVRIPS